ncbi:NAD(P)/FAD-dependent oxidoreductase [Halorubrum sp. DTA98]|uniref:NAD(P)/FAD-dependent oxidoreductase n=1 Tax=Halorubrum sp. DTA98 TaxID=3402163 RepID=UPI003AACE82C
MSDQSVDTYEVLIIGGGVAGLTAGVYTGRASLDTLVVNAGEPIVKRNAHLENVPGFPAGVNPRLFLDMLRSQATRSGVDLRDGRVTRLDRAEGTTDAAESVEGGARFVATVEREGGSAADESDDGDADGYRVAAERVIAASWADPDYLDALDVEIRDAGSKRYVDDDGLGRTNVDGVYVAGRLAERYHQTVIAAGNGAEVATTLIHDSEVPFYHDWVAPEGYFTDRDRDVPPGCEEISETERRARERESMAAMREYFAEPHDERQRTHPSLVDDDLGRLPDDE